MNLFNLAQRLKMRGRIFLLLLFAANAHNILWVLGAVDENIVTKQLNRMEMDQYMDILEVKSLIYKILQAIDKNADKLGKEEPQKETKVCKSLPGSSNEGQMTSIFSKLQQVVKMEDTLELVKTQVQENANNIKILLGPICKQWLMTQKLSSTNIFSAEKKHFYFNITSTIWSNARSWCAERSMQMANIQTASQLEAVANELKARTSAHYYWLSASNVGQRPGQYRWADGTPVDDDLWRNGGKHKSQGDSNKASCAIFQPGNPKLGDEWCSHSGHRILCEVPSALAVCP